MSRKTHVSPTDPFINPQYSNWLNMLIEFIQPTDLFLIAGRGASKTDIFAERLLNILYDMPHSQQVLVSDTYVNSLKNIIPTVFEGLERKGWKFGRDYVTDERPPKHFKNCYKPIESFKHTISTKTGVRLLVGSLDQPSGLAGNSFQHMYGDEGRLLKFKKLKKLDPAIRGEHAQFGHSVFYRGRTFMSDMPNILDGDDDWMLSREKDMNIEQIKAALQVGIVLNDIRKEMYNAQIDRNQIKVEQLRKNLARWTEKWIRVRKESTFFYVVSSMVNSDILQEGFFRDTFKALGIDEFKSAILSFKVNITKGEKFYGHLGEHHFYSDGVISEYYDKFLLRDVAEGLDESSRALKYIDHNAKLECGIDFGDMCSMVMAQQRGAYLYCLKEFYTLAPESSRELAMKFREFFKDHKKKELDMYYDRSGNQYAKIKRDWASELKNFIEFNGGISTGWTVNLKSLNQSTIYQEEEFTFAKSLMGETVPGLPKLKIDQFQCKCLKSSLELTKIKVKVDIKGSRSIQKDKSSEKLPMHLRPMFSTNFSDAFKYLIYRRAFVEKLPRDGGGEGMEPVIF
jgi:hypothetical protein